MDQLKERFQVSRWIAEDIAGTISESHKASLQAWRRRSDANEHEYRELLRDIREGKKTPHIGKQETRNQWYKFEDTHIPRPKMLIRWSRYAAFALLLLGIAAIIQTQIDNKNTPGQKEKIHLAKGDVTLTLPGGKKIKLGVTAGVDTMQALQKGINAEINFARKTIVYSGDTCAGQNGQYNTITTPRGGEFILRLADGSKIWLNSGTEIRYPGAFTGNSRIVYLKGEAYFEVAKDDSKPFIVKTSGSMDIRVLGTSFNISSYEDDDEIITTLAKGSVEVLSPGGTLRITPDQQALFNKNTRRLSQRKVDAGTYTAWKDGKFIFEDQPLGQIMKQLGRWYEMETFYTAKTAETFRFSGNLKKYDDFEKIIKMIEEVSGLSISIKNKTITIGTK